MDQEHQDDFWIKQRDTFKELADRETDLLNDRTNVFLLYNSILLAGLALGDPAFSIELILGLSGLFATLIWIYLGNRGAKLTEHAWQKVLESEAKISQSVPHTLTEYIEHRNRTRPKVFGRPASVYVGMALPLMWAVTWLVILLW